MTKKEVISKIKQAGAMAIVRMDNPDIIMPVIEALQKGGVSVIEITLTVPDAVNLIRKAAQETSGEVLIGAGSVLNRKDATEVIDAGAQFIVSPVFKPEIMETAISRDVPCLPGAYTPTEILTAHEAGAEVVKVFPADSLGMSYFKAVKAPMPHLNLMPTGGVSLTNAGDWLKAGAFAVGIGGALLDKKVLANKDFTQLTKNAEILMQSINQARN